MNYNISGIDMMILEVFAMFDTAKVEIKKEHQSSNDFLNLQTKEKSSIVELVLRLSEYNNHLNRVGVDLPDKTVMVLQSHCHQAVRAS